jgi:hypothetical protein
MSGFLVRIEGHQVPDCATVFLTEGRVLKVGRHIENDIWLPEVTVSRYHLELRQEANRALVSLISTTNGFRVNDERAGAEARVGVGDTIAVGGSRLTLEAAPAINSAWLAWNGRAVPRLSRAVRGEGAHWRSCTVPRQTRPVRLLEMGSWRPSSDIVVYDSQVLPVDADPAGMAMLADALEDSGCSDPSLLGHLRRPGRHWRGCWAVSLLLGQS